jgi:hypothetical protein
MGMGTLERQKEKMSYKKNTRPKGRVVKGDKGIG